MHLRIINQHKCVIKKTCYGIFLGSIEGGLFFQHLGLRVTCIVFRAIYGILSGIKEEKERIEEEEEKDFFAFLIALSGSLASGDTFLMAIDNIRKELKEGNIRKQTNSLIGRISLNIPMSKALSVFRENVSSKKVKNWLRIFELTYHQGANLEMAIKNNREILYTTLRNREEKKALIEKQKSSKTLMKVMPLIIIGMIILSSKEYASALYTPSARGVMVTMYLILVISDWMIEVIINKIYR